MRQRAAFRAACSLGAALAGLFAGPAAATPAVSDAVAIMRTLVDVDTSAAHGTTAAALAVRKLLLDAGFPEADLELLAPPGHPERANLVVRLRGRGAAKPVLAIGHLDVVPPGAIPWQTDPFRLTEKDGYYYGRGTLDMKGENAVLLAAMTRMRKEGTRPARDIVLALTADEEAGTANGVEWLLKAHPDKIAAAFAINPDEGAAGLSNGRHVNYGVQNSTKRYMTFRLEASAKGGSSAMPLADNAIYRLAMGLERFSRYRFPVHLLPTTRAYFTAIAKNATGQEQADLLAVAKPSPDLAAAERLSENPERAAALRTTCVATQLQAGSVENALAEKAGATIQCRVMPGGTPEIIRAAITRTVGDPAIDVILTEAGLPNPEPPPSPRIIDAVAKTVHSMWPDVPVVPSLNIATSDSVYLRAAGVPTFGLCTIFYELDDVRIHAVDERISMKAFNEAVEYGYRLLVALGNLPEEASPRR